MYCQTNIKHNGEFFPAGANVDPGAFGDQYEVLVEMGALGPLPPSVKGNQQAAEEIVARDRRIAELEAQLGLEIDDEEDDD